MSSVRSGWRALDDRYGALGTAILLYVASRPLIDAFVYADVAVFGRDVTLGQAWGVGLIALLAAFLLGRMPRVRRARVSTLVLAAFVGAYAAATVFRPSAGFALVAGGRLAAWLLLALAVERIASTVRGQRRTILAVVLAALLLVGVIAVAIALDRYGFAYYNEAENYKFRGSGAFYQAPFVYASLALFTLPFIFAATFAGSTKSRVLAFGLASLLAVSIVLSFVRSTYFGLISIAGAYVAPGVRWTRSALFGIAVFGLAAVSIAAVFHDMILRRFTEGSTRVRLWRTIFDAATGSFDTALLGGGAGFSRRVWESATGVPGGDWSHNDFLELFATGGPLLVALYLLVLAWIFASIWRLYRQPGQSPAARRFAVLGLGAFVAFVAVSFFDGIIFSAPSLLIGTFVGLARGMQRTPGATFLDGPAREDASVAEVPSRPVGRTAPVRAVGES